MKTVEQLNRTIAPDVVRAYGAIRRFVISLTDEVRWQLVGVLMPDGPEAHRAEVFGGIGIYARPPAGVEAEAIAVMSGDANAPAIVGIREEQTRAAVAGNLQPDETALYNSKALVYVRQDGTIEARSKGGTAKRLATLDDLNALADWIHTEMIVNASGATAGTTTSPPSADGTQTFEAE